ncbi:hypothetical protein HK405_008069 [Cladochytrium tenue]|nr:hypothetical protein HK405_008069 [Cladochytrium tenue]
MPGPGAAAASPVPVPMPPTLPLPMPRPAAATLRVVATPSPVAVVVPPRAPPRLAAMAAAFTLSSSDAPTRSAPAASVAPTAPSTSPPQQPPPTPLPPPQQQQPSNPLPPIPPAPPQPAPVPREPPARHWWRRLPPPPPAIVIDPGSVVHPATSGLPAMTTATLDDEEGNGNPFRRLSNPGTGEHEHALSTAADFNPFLDLLQQPQQQPGGRSSSTPPVAGQQQPFLSVSYANPSRLSPVLDPFGPTPPAQPTGVAFESQSVPVPPRFPAASFSPPEATLPAVTFSPFDPIQHLPAATPLAGSADFDFTLPNDLRATSMPAFIPHDTRRVMPHPAATGSLSATSHVSDEELAWQIAQADADEALARRLAAAGGGHDMSEDERLARELAMQDTPVGTAPPALPEDERLIAELQDEEYARRVQQEEEEAARRAEQEARDEEFARRLSRPTTSSVELPRPLSPTGYGLGAGAPATSFLAMQPYSSLRRFDVVFNPIGGRSVISEQVTRSRKSTFHFRDFSGTDYVVAYRDSYNLYHTGHRLVLRPEAEPIIDLVLATYVGMLAMGRELL